MPISRSYGNQEILTRFHQIPSREASIKRRGNKKSPNLEWRKEYWKIVRLKQMNRGLCTIIRIVRIHSWNNGNNGDSDCFIVVREGTIRAGMKRTWRVVRRIESKPYDKPNGQGKPLGRSTQDQRSSFLDSEYAKKEEEEDRGIEYTTERTKHQREY